MRLSTRSIAIWLFIFMMPSSLVAQCLSYEPECILLPGKIVRKTFPGRPGFGSIKNGDEPETYWILILDHPFCAVGEFQESHYDEAGVKEVQLVFVGQGNEYKKYRKLVNKRVIVSGQLYPMQTGHHHTNVLITVKDIKRSTANEVQTAQPTICQ